MKKLFLAFSIAACTLFSFSCNEQHHRDDDTGEEIKDDIEEAGDDIEDAVDHDH